MNQGFQDMKAVRDAFDACVNNPVDPGALQRFHDAHAAHQDSYVDSFEVAGVTYPRTDGHRMSETQARQAIEAFLGRGEAASQLKPEVVAIAYPLPDEVLRKEIEAMLVTASTIAAMDWKVANVKPDEARALRDLLRMPAEVGSYDALIKSKADCKVDGINPYRGYSADHLIPDKAMRGPSVVRNDSPCEGEGFATFLLDGQNKGSQHKFATDGQRAVLNEFKVMGRNPTVGEYLERVHVWMTNIYTRADLAVDGIKGSAMTDRVDFKPNHVKGYAIAQAGFMTWPERNTVGRALATALLIEARDYYTSIGWDMKTELPLVTGKAVAAAPAKPPCPTAGKGT